MRYRKATFYFYTGTGNSYRVAAWMADAVRATGATVDLTPIGAACPLEEIGDEETSLLGLVMPTHGFTTPWAMLRFALALPRRARTQAVVVATRGATRIGSTYLPGFEGTATWLVALILLLKGYDIRGTVGIDMPSNWMTLHPAPPPDAVAEILTRARKKVVSFIAPVLSGQRCFAGWAVLPLGVLLFPLSLAYLGMGRFFLSKLFFASNRCNGCGLCAAHCPNEAIVMRGHEDNRRPYWTFRCESCMRCMAYCPQKAVEASHLLAVILYVLAGAIQTAGLLTRLGTRIPLLGFLLDIPGWIVGWGNSLIVLSLLSPAFYWVLSIKWVNVFFTHATLTHYYKRYREPETTLQELK
jgi:Pyruvate/2-oxoacid:ferredoxin oxidoreductase delta subunit